MKISSKGFAPLETPIYRHQQKPVLKRVSAAKFLTGFTFVELLVYIGLFAVISVLVVNTILMTIKAFNVFRVSQNINSNAELAMERMTREIRLADEINDVLSVFNGHPGQLFLNTINPQTGATTTIEFFLATTTLMVREAAASAQILTSSKALITNLVFRKITNSDISKAVKIELEMRSGEGAFQKTEKFYNTAILRRSY